MLVDENLPQTWYHRCPALVLLGSRSTASVSGRTYQAATEQVGEVNLVTIDLSPCIGDVWGDCARSFPIECGRYAEQPSRPEFVEGMKIERQLHQLLRSQVTPETRFSDLHSMVETELERLEWENLDFGGNFGHSIERRLDDRIYIDPSNDRRLGGVECFTFEPHVRRIGSQWGFKHEDIYFFDSEGRVCVL